MNISSHIRKAGIGVGMTLVAVCAPAWAASLAAPTPVPSDAMDQVAPAAPLALEHWSTGSASLVPVMAADTPSREHASNVDAPANTTVGAVGKPADDLAFVRQATESGRKEVASARNAVEQLKRPELKRVAEMLVNDHSSANAKLSKLAEAKGWPLPGPQPAAPPPSGTASGDFDTRWTAEMIAGHERSVSLYRAQAESGEDKDLRQFARDTLPTIEHHLAELKSLQK
jgi:putative membrane protein